MKRKITGNLSGVRDRDIEALEAVTELESAGYCDEPIMSALCGFTAKYNREAAVGISRGGHITFLSAGSNSSAEIVQDSRRKGLSGIRIIHTHPGDETLSDVDISVLTLNRLDAITAVNAGTGRPEGFETAFLMGGMTERIRTRTLDDDLLFNKIEAADKLARAEVNKTVTQGERERAVLIGADLDGTMTESIEELELLCEAAGAECVGKVLQNRRTPDRASMIGSGKIDEIRMMCQVTDADMVICDNELSGIQIKNLEDALGVKVIDRSALILDIFAGRAKTVEGKLQVELAQLKYNLPRLIGHGSGMDKMRSGIGMRGPGEKKLETDRRLIREQITDLERRLEKMESGRELRRRNRTEGMIPSVALVGYTNAGKSTVMNALSHSEVFVKDMLFATLDPVTRRVRDAEGRTYLLTDTVGFINKLPHHFIEAFKSTLEEAVNADILLHIMDISDPNLLSHHATVMDVLKKIGATAPVITVYNKIDRIDGYPPLPVNTDFVKISATVGTGMENLKNTIIKRLFK